MLSSMTGFGSSHKNIYGLGKASVELRSSNHKFLEIIMHLPEGFLSLEEKVRQAIETKIKRGRLICVVTLTNGKRSGVFINRNLAKSYLNSAAALRKQLHIKDTLTLNDLLRLPGVLSLVEQRLPAERVWPQLKPLVSAALENLVSARRKEGRALYIYLKKRAQTLKSNALQVKARFEKAIKERLVKIKDNEERASFLKGTDISEELQRLVFHTRNFKNKIAKSAAVGKELDFIAQEMQREANTIAAKSFDASISNRVIQIKSQIEKIREQTQNAE
jgi:uncharacterized protein (TIGR00255 family)